MVISIPIPIQRSAQDPFASAGITTFTCPTTTKRAYHRERPHSSGSSSSSVGAANAIEPHAVLDLTPVYAKAGGPQPLQPPTSKVIRGFAMVQASSRILVSDEWVSTGATNLTWSMHYQSDDVTVVLSADNRSAVLKAVSDGASIRATIESASGMFSIVTPNIPPPQHPVGGVRKLAVVISDPRTATALQVSFAIPGTPALGDTNPPSMWSASGVRASKEQTEEKR